MAESTSSFPFMINLITLIYDGFLFYLGTQEEAAEAYDIAAIKFRGTSAVTNFDISRYDVQRICSSSTLIGSDLAKRSPKDLTPNAIEEYNSCASSTSTQPLLPITTGEASDELVDMVVSSNPNDHQNAITDGSVAAAPNSRNSSNPQSPKSSVGFATDSGIGGGDYSQSYLPKYAEGGDDNGSSDNGNNNRLDSLGLVHQVPMFALWNE